MSYDVAELKRRFDNLLMVGAIHEVDHDNKKLKVKVGELITGWLPWPADVAANYVRWRPLKPGIQCVIASPSGELTQAIIIQILYTTELDSPETADDMDVITFNDGTEVRYDSTNSVLSIECAGDINVNAQGNMNAEVSGALSANVTGDAAIDAANIALNGGQPCVTTGHTCVFSGSNHPIGSSTVKAGV
ncbi:phage baseplate assembly protein V [Pseudoalteromonas luteoviolacea]|uniref:phage baseplate assembly protein V n=1 Tax=Pseudoalteromonas luteoviolacea TaxID=43657 RepID=UPI001154EA73|nr:phage baseplate assembly protein V [Pseudoalteromonas luteoviolacea]TQF69550.1 phage baseplate assembly protein V [Pseudoalteromonas luteoviolacea]